MIDYYKLIEKFIIENGILLSEQKHLIDLRTPNYNIINNFINEYGNVKININIIDLINSSNSR